MYVHVSYDVLVVVSFSRLLKALKRNAQFSLLTKNVMKQAMLHCLNNNLVWFEKHVEMISGSGKVS